MKTHFIWGRVDNSEQSSDSRDTGSPRGTDPPSTHLREWPKSAQATGGKDIHVSVLPSSLSRSERSKSDCKSGRQDFAPTNLWMVGPGEQPVAETPIGPPQPSEASRACEPREWDVELWSKGSEKHGAGKCRPCHFFHTKAGCSSGSKCKFCHVPHTNSGKLRVGMSKRIACKRIADSLQSKCAGDPQAFNRELEEWSSHSSYLRNILEERLAAMIRTNEGGAALCQQPRDTSRSLLPHCLDDVAGMNAAANCSGQASPTRRIVMSM